MATVEQAYNKNGLEPTAEILSGCMKKLPETNWIRGKLTMQIKDCCREALAEFMSMYWYADTLFIPK